MMMMMIMTEKREKRKKGEIKTHLESPGAPLKAGQATPRHARLRL